jgi:hypothetical protein
MWWVAGWAVVAAIGICGVVASVNGVRFGRRVAQVISPRRRMSAPWSSWGPRLSAIVNVDSIVTNMFPIPFTDRSRASIRYVQWSALDEHRATATLQVNDRSVTAAFEFGPDELPAAFSAERYYDDGGGKAVMTPWVGRFSDYRFVDGVLVPHRVVAAWVLDGIPIEYARFDVQHVEFDANAPF